METKKELAPRIEEAMGDSGGGLTGLGWNKNELSPRIEEATGISGGG